MKVSKISLGIALMVMILSACVNKYDPENDFNVSPVDGEKSVQINWYRGLRWRSVEIPQEISKLPVTRIGDSAFQGKYLDGVTIPYSVTEIGIWAFAGNQLTNITIPDSVSKIGKFAFNGNKLSSITIGADVVLGNEDSKKYISSFDSHFDAFYKTNGSLAGTYIFEDGSWSFM